MELALYVDFLKEQAEKLSPQPLPAMGDAPRPPGPSLRSLEKTLQELEASAIGGPGGDDGDDGDDDDDVPYGEASSPTAPSKRPWSSAGGSHPPEGLNVADGN
jgi:hypothetical protein